MFVIGFSLFSCHSLVAGDPHLNPTQIEISDSDQRELEEYFRFMLTKTEVGYVLFGIKPISTHGEHVTFPCAEQNIYRMPLDHHFERIRRGFDVWFRYFGSNNRGPVAIVRYDIHDRGWRNIDWIHKNALHSVVNQNLPIFQVSLGPEITSDEILNRLCDEKSAFYLELKRNKVLTGIILGYGTKNALYQSRLETIEEAGYQKERLPLASRGSRDGLRTLPSVESCRLLNAFTEPALEVTPSFGYENLKQEHKSLSDKLITTRRFNYLSPALPTFAYIRDDPVSQELLQEYCEAQEKIGALLNSDTFLEDVLTHILGYRPNLVTVVSDQESEEVALKREKKDVVDAVALSIWKNLLEKDSDYIASTIKGMRLAEEEKDDDLSEQNELVMPLALYMNAIQAQKANMNLEKSVRLMQGIAEKEKNQAIVPNKLYYRVVRSGTGSCLNDTDRQVKIGYSISRLQDGEILATSTSEECQFKDLMPGLIRGMQGMRIGEVREIFIHPDYAYGFRSNYEPCLALKAKVELISFSESKSASSVKSDPVDDCQSYFSKQIKSDEMENLKLSAAFAEGYNAWSFYGEGGDLYSLDEVVASLMKAKGFNEELNQCDLLTILRRMIYRKKTISSQ
ncbi:MAG: FKBP-type peptidyl-prolyl cis-trans isomerase [Waddliaceae bacterium]